MFIGYSDLALAVVTGSWWCGAQDRIEQQPAHPAGELHVHVRRVGQPLQAQPDLHRVPGQDNLERGHVAARPRSSARCRTPSVSGSRKRAWQAAKRARSSGCRSTCAQNSKKHQPAAAAVAPLDCLPWRTSRTRSGPDFAHAWYHLGEHVIDPPLVDPGKQVLLEVKLE